MKRVISISLIIILLLGNSSITMATHFCGGIAMLSEITLGNKNLDCGMEMDDYHLQADNQIPNQSVLKGPKCCDDHYQSFETDDLTVPSKISVNSFNFVFVTSYLVAFTPEVITSEYFNSKLRKPILPLVISDLTVMHEAFLL